MPILQGFLPPECTEPVQRDIHLQQGRRQLYHHPPHQEELPVLQVPEMHRGRDEAQLDTKRRGEAEEVPRPEEGQAGDG